MGVLYNNGTGGYCISHEATALFKRLTRDAPRFHKYYDRLYDAPRNMRPLVCVWLILGSERFGGCVECEFIDSKYRASYRVIQNTDYSETVAVNHDRYLTQRTANILKKYNNADAAEKLRALYAKEYTGKPKR